MKNMIQTDVAFCNIKRLNFSFVRSGYVKDLNNQTPKDEFTFYPDFLYRTTN